MPHCQKEKKGNSGKTKDERKKAKTKEEKKDIVAAEDLVVGDVIEVATLPLV